jgi:hypothetical protein
LYTSEYPGINSSQHSASLGINFIALFIILRRRGRDSLDLNLGQRCGLASKIGCPRVRVLGVVVGDGGLDGILCKHGAVH